MKHNKILVLIVIIVIFSFTALACGGTSQYTDSNSSATNSSASNSSATNSSASTSSRCVVASSPQLNIIQSGVKGIDDGNYVDTAWAVKSKDFDNVWMVAAYIYGTGMEDGAGPGVWAISGDTNSPGLTMAVDGYAKSFTNYPDASKSDAQIGLYDDGVQEAINCAESNK